MDGYEVCKRLKASERTKDVPVIFISALSEMFNKIQAFEVGGIDYITKPFELEEVKLRVETHIRAKESAEAQAELLAYREKFKAAEALKASEDRFRRAIDYAPFPVMVHAEDGEVLAVSRGLTESSGYTLSDIPTVNDWITLALGSCAAEMRERVPKWFEENVAKDEGECTIRRKDGSERIWDYSSAQLGRLEDGRMAVISMAMDVTEKRLAEAALRRAKDELESQVAERTAALSASNMELESFAFSVSHDLRSPLRAIDGFTRILLEQYTKILDPEGQRLFGIIRDSVKGMDQLIQDLLEVSRLGRTALASKRVDMRAMANEAFAKLTEPFPGNGFELAIADLPDANADPSMMERVWTNLISNAIKYSRDSATKRIEIGASTEGGMTSYSVKDHGIGFDPRYTDKLFGLFQRLHAPTEYEGTGVGLAIVKRIVERHGGRVWAEGKPGEGAAFYFSLPSAT
jgi:PAS domain S-box-containing protein